MLRGESPAEVVGVAGDVTHSGLGAEAQPLVYLPMEQWPRWQATVVVKTSRDPLTFVAAVRRAVRAIDPDQPIDSIATLDQRVDRTLAEDRYRAQLLALFSALAVTLAAVGLYGVLSYVTSQRGREIAIRMALGARAGDIVLAIVGHGMKRAIAGMALGAAAAAALARIVESLLFEMAPADPAALAGAAAVLVLATLLACAVPARRAARTDPIAVLKYE